MNLNTCCNDELIDGLDDLGIPHQECCTEFRYYVVSDSMSSSPVFSSIHEAKQFIFDRELDRYTKCLGYDTMDYYIDQVEYEIFLKVISISDLEKDHSFQSKLQEARDQAWQEYNKKMKPIRETIITKEKAKRKALYEELKAEFEPEDKPREKVFGEY